jgi:hypothetical protein
MREGRIVDAKRDLACMRAIGFPVEEHVASRTLEQVDRVVGRFEASLDELYMDPAKGWIKDWLVEGIEFGYHILDGTLSLVSVAEYDGCDILKAFAAICEVDLCHGYKTNVTCATPVDGWHATDSVWRILQYGMMSGGLEDNVVQLSIVDALDEPLGSLWASMYVPSHVSGLHGMKPPGPQAGAARALAGHSTVCITPVATSSSMGSEAQRFRMKMAVSGPVPRAVALMPSILLKAAVRRCAKDMVAAFWKHATECAELDHRISASPRARFYSAIRQHLLGIMSRDNDVAKDSPSLTPGTLSPATSGCGSSTGTDSCKESEADPEDSASLHPVYMQLADFLNCDCAEGESDSADGDIAATDAHIHEQLETGGCTFVRLEDFLSLSEPREEDSAALHGDDMLRQMSQLLHSSW